MLLSLILAGVFIALTFGGALTFLYYFAKLTKEEWVCTLHELKHNRDPVGMEVEL